MPYKEKEIEKLYYTIGEVAKMFDVNTSHIRFWSKEFDIIKPATNKKGNRLFTIDDIANFKIIYQLVKVKGFTLKGAKNEIKGNRKNGKAALVDSGSLQPEGTHLENLPQVNTQPSSIALKNTVEPAIETELNADQTITSNKIISPNDELELDFDNDLLIETLADKPSVEAFNLGADDKIDLVDQIALENTLENIKRTLQSIDLELDALKA
jgi:DNA-binding transcriptional MerR regulator